MAGTVQVARFFYVGWGYRVVFVSLKDDSAYNHRLRADLGDSAALSEGQHSAGRAGRAAQYAAL